MEVQSSHREFKLQILLEKTIFCLLTITSLVILSWILFLAKYGFDFTDEASYIVWMSNPFNYSISVTQFGFIYHPIFQLLSGDIAGLRQFNIVITFGLAWLLSYFCLISMFHNPIQSKPVNLIISAALATSSLIYFDSWLLTPSYNSLALQSLLLTMLGFLFADNTITRKSVLGWLLIGVGGWLAFMAKITTAAALGVCILPCLLIAGKFNFRLFVLTVFTATILLIASALIIDGSIMGFVNRLIGGATFADKLGGGHTLSNSLRRDKFYLGSRGNFIFYSSIFILFFVAYLCRAVEVKRLVIGFTALAALSIFTLALIFEYAHVDITRGTFEELLVCAIPFATILIGVSIYRLGGLIAITRSQWALAICFLVLPFVYTFGTNINYWLAGSHAVFFWILSGVILLGPISSVRSLLVVLLPVALAVQFASVALIRLGIEDPYRQPEPLYTNNFDIEIRNPGSDLRLSKDFGSYLAQAAQISRQAGFQKNTPMIDLSGHSPGVLYAIGANSIGQAWTIGSYPGSYEVTVAAFSKVPCEQLAVSWLITEFQGPRRISPDFLLSFGADIVRDFEVVGSFVAPAGAGGYDYPREQKFLKPIRPVDVAIAACVEARRKIQ